jgi:hypothetical protein
MRAGMTEFSRVLQSVDSDDFEAVFKLALKSLSIEQLQLQQAVKSGSTVLSEGITVMVISRQQTEQFLQVKAGIFFRSMIAGCNCADDPSPVETLEEYTEALISVNKKDASFSISFV